MNKDLELLKREVQFIESCEMTCEIGTHAAFKNIYECAERTATALAEKDAEIKQLKASLDLYNRAYFEHPSGDMTGKKQLDELAAENERLRKFECLGDDCLTIRSMERRIEDVNAQNAKLRKKSHEIITCSECKYRGTEDCWLSETDDTDDEYESFWETVTNDDDFCSRAVRKEAE